MHEALHIVVLVAVLAGAASLATLVIWPLSGERPMAPRTRWVLASLVAAAGAALLLEWRVVH